MAGERRCEYPSLTGCATRCNAPWKSANFSVSINPMEPIPKKPVTEPMSTPTNDLPQPKHIAGDLWGGLAAMLVALPAAIAFGVAIMAPLGGSLGAQGAMAGVLGAAALGLVAPALGGSTRLITAPCAPAAAVLSALAVGFAQAGMPVPSALLLLGLIGLLAGLIQIALGVAGVGRLIRFIPFPVVSGYLSGVGLIIIGSQIPKLLGVEGGHGLFDTLSHPSAWVWQSLLVGAVVAAAMLLMPRLTKVVPATILALLAGVLCYALLGWFTPALLTVEHNPLLVGRLTAGGVSVWDSLGLRLPGADLWSIETVWQVAVPALTLAVLLSIDTLKTCVVVDAMTRSRHDANRELIGQGLGNMASSLIGGIPGAGTMGASLINISSGGTTRLSGFFAGVTSLLALLLFAPLIAWVPVSALAAILIVTGFRMIDWRSLAFFNSPATRLDFMVIVSVILVALFGNLIAASGIGVALSILLFIREQTRSSVVRNRIDGLDLFAQRERTLSAPADKGREVVVFELQGSLFFGTANQLQVALEPETASRKYVILNMHRVQSLDVTATHVLEQIKEQLEQRNAFLVFCDIPKGLPSGLKMKKFLKETGVVRPSDKAFAFRQLEDALKWIEERDLELSAEMAGDASLAPDSVAPVPVERLELSGMPVLQGHTPQAIEALRQLLVMRKVRSGKKLFKYGHGGEDLYLVSGGQLQVRVFAHKKPALPLATLEPGELLCDNGFLQTGCPQLEAIATTDAEVFCLSRANFAQLAEHHGLLATALLSEVTRNLSWQLGQAWVPSEPLPEPHE